MKESIRIPVFEGEFLFNVRNELVVEIDQPDYRWIDQNWKPEIPSQIVGQLYDSVAEQEVFRMLRFNTCPYCRETMQKLIPVGDDGVVFVCRNCFSWGGRGTRPGGPTNRRAVLGRMQFVNNPDEVKIDFLINHLSQNIDKLYGLTPRQAEKLLPIVLSDYLDCEVKAIGGVKDGGIDALALRSENEKIIVQIKWRSKKSNSEAVSVVREVGGTLLARKIPKGIIISTRRKFSKSAIEESKHISQNEIVDVGRIDLTLKDFNDLIDMFNISAKKRSDLLSNEDIIPAYNSGFDLFGNL